MVKVPRSSEDREVSVRVISEGTNIRPMVLLTFGNAHVQCSVTEIIGECL